MFYLPKEEKVFKGLIFHSKYLFLAIHAKGGESKPKAKGPHHHLILKLMIFKLVSHCVQKGEKVVFSKLIS
jgi:hypothetical protein